MEAIARHAVQRVTSTAVDVAAAVEDLLSDGSGKPLAHRPLFIIGAPRSGTTLMYQCVVQSFDVGFLTNRHCRFMASPAVVERFHGRRSPDGSFRSSYGRTVGESGPSECGAYWYRFFRRTPQYVPLEAASESRLRALRGSIRALGNASGRPLVFKNLPCALRLQPLSHALPEALFIVVRRDLHDVACSILEARQNLRGGLQHWWSLEPPEIDVLRRLPVEAQAVEQARAIGRLIERDARQLGAGRFAWVEYSHLCERPDRVMDELAAFAAGHGVRLSRRPGSLPQRFDTSVSTDLSDEVRARVQDYLSKESARPCASGVNGPDGRLQG